MRPTTTLDFSGELATTLLELAPDATVIVDASGTIVFANARIEHTFGYAPAELAGANVEALLPQRFRSAHAQHRALYSTQPKPRPMGSGTPLLGMHKNGAEFPIEISLSPVPSAKGLLVVAAIRDATQRRETERQLVESNRAKSRLLAAASHDLRQPVQTLNLLNRAAARHAGANAALKEILDHQQVALDTMSALLTSVLDISKLDNGGIRADIVAAPIDAIFDRLHSDFEPQAAERGIELIVEPTDEGAYTDPELLRRLLGNLLSNAIRYTARGSVHLGSKRVGEEIEIAVRDTGIGIAADQIERIFDEFYQVDQGTQRPDGLGLGLSIVRRLASLLESRIQVQSQPGTGTTFSLRLPRAALARIEPRPAPGASTPAGGNVLVVDDEPAVAHATTLLLELEGFVVRTASCAREAIEQAATSLPDLIISDYHLRGGETGVEVVKALRARFGTTIPAVFVTGDTGTAAFTEPKLQKSSVLSKPLRADELLTVIRNQIGTPS